jgi:FkbM family methyltransferase
VNAPSRSENVPLVEDLVYDVGLHKGEDSAFYLAKGYRVVAFEANPDLIAACKQRFAAEIAAERMTIVEGAITDFPAPTVRFYKHPESGWGTTNEEWVARNLAVGQAEPVDVPAVSMSDTLRRTGIPSFMKIDVEGADGLCLQALLDFEQRPLSVSIEANPYYSDSDGLASELALLQRLGYDRFAIVQQASIPSSEVATHTLSDNPLRFRFEQGSSGAFGSDVGPWMDAASVRSQYKRLFFASRVIAPLVWRIKFGRSFLKRVAAHLPRRGGTGWYDTHAARSTAWRPPTFAD